MNLSFWKLTDADFTQPDHVYVIPEGTTIAPGTAPVFENETMLLFGLGGADSARLLAVRRAQSRSVHVDDAPGRREAAALERHWQLRTTLDGHAERYRTLACKEQVHA